MMCPYCMQRMLKAGWNVSITPLDTCSTPSTELSAVRRLIQQLESGSECLSPLLLYRPPLPVEPGHQPSIRHSCHSSYSAQYCQIGAICRKLLLKRSFTVRVFLPSARDFHGHFLSVVVTKLTSPFELRA